MALVPVGDALAGLTGKRHSHAGSRKSSKIRETPDLNELLEEACVPCGPSDVSAKCVNDGRACPRCARKDTDHDPGSSDPLATCPFGTGARSEVTGLWRGIPCFYCLRVFEARFKKDLKSFEKFVHKCGIDKDFNDEVEALVVFLIEKCLELGGPFMMKFRIDWAAAHERIKLELQRFKKVEIKQPDKYLMPIGHYMANPKFGNPLENGLGHRQITREGEKYMLVHDEDGTYARKYARMSVSDGILTNLTQDLG